jgi:hypothetical protein
MRTYASTVLALVIALILIASAMNLASIRAYAHTFKTDENVDFITMVQIIKVETSLAGENASDSDTASHHIEHASEALTNSTLEEIAEKNQRIATDLPASIENLGTAIDSSADSDTISQNVQEVSNLLDEAAQVRIEQAQRNNSTVQAFVVANLVDEALEHYGEAVGFEGNMTDMSNMNMSDSSMSGMQAGNESSSQGMTGNDTMMSSQSIEEDNETAKVVSLPNYQSAKAFAEKAQELYQEIKPEALAGTENAITSLDAAFPEFVNAIDAKASAMDMMEIGHLRIHPNLMTAYNLQVIPEFPVPLLLTLPALASAILFGRLKGKRG